MRQCLLPYFDKEQFSGDLRLNKTSFENLSELEESVGKLLEGDLPFRTKTDIGDAQYEESVNELIQVLYSKIDELNLQFDFDASSKRELNRFVKGLLLPKPLTRTEYVIQANIAGSDLITEDERRNIRFNNLVRSIYGKGTSPLNASRQEQFNGDMLLRTIIDTSKKKLVTNEQELNMGIVSYQQDQYNILRNYLEQQGYDLSAYGIPQSVYHTDTTTKVPTLTKGYSNILTLMYNVIEKARREGVLEQQLEDGWTKFILNNQDTTLYRALNAYINLAYFDDVLQQFLGEYIQINRDYDAPINVIKNELGEQELKFKYTLARGNVFATKTWVQSRSASSSSMAGETPCSTTKTSTRRRRQSTREAWSSASSTVQPEGSPAESSSVMFTKLPPPRRAGSPGWPPSPPRRCRPSRHSGPTRPRRRTRRSRWPPSPRGWRRG